MRLVAPTPFSSFDSWATSMTPARKVERRAAATLPERDNTLEFCILGGLFATGLILTHLCDGVGGCVDPVQEGCTPVLGPFLRPVCFQIGASDLCTGWAFLPRGLQRIKGHQARFLGPFSSSPSPSVALLAPSC